VRGQCCLAPEISSNGAEATLHTMLMSSQPPGNGAIPVEGDVRFDSSGQLETFDGAGWVPLRRISDIEPTPVFREADLPPGRDRPPGEHETQDQADTADGPASS
jgi:hypothetical protein